MRRSGLLSVLAGILSAAVLMGCNGDEEPGDGILACYSLGAMIGNGPYRPWGEEGLAMDGGFILKITRIERGDLPAANQATVTLDGAVVPQIDPPPQINPANQAFFRMLDIGYAANRVYNVQVNLADMGASAALQMPSVTSVNITGPNTYTKGNPIGVTWTYAPAGQFPDSVFLEYLAVVNMAVVSDSLRLDGKKTAYTIPGEITGLFDNGSSVLVFVSLDFPGLSWPFSSTTMPLLAGSRVDYAGMEDTRLITPPPP